MEVPSCIISAFWWKGLKHSCKLTDSRVPFLITTEYLFPQILHISCSMHTFHCNWNVTYQRQKRQKRKWKLLLLKKFSFPDPQFIDLLRHRSLPYRTPTFETGWGVTATRINSNTNTGIWAHMNTNTFEYVSAALVIMGWVNVERAL